MMHEWYVYMARPPKIVIVLSVLPNWNKIVNQSINPPIFNQSKNRDFCEFLCI